MRVLIPSYCLHCCCCCCQVYALDKRFLDPRRPMRAKVTPEEAEERLLPYHELVVFNALQYPTQDKQVRRGSRAGPQQQGCTGASGIDGATAGVVQWGNRAGARVGPAAAQQCRVASSLSSSTQVAACAAACTQCSLAYSGTVTDLAGLVAFDASLARGECMKAVQTSLCGLLAHLFTIG
jgi:hypothetical protein